MTIRYACFWRDEPARYDVRGPERVYALVLSDESRRVRVVRRWTILVSDLDDPWKERLVEGHIAALESLWREVQRRSPETYREAVELGYHVPPLPRRPIPKFGRHAESIGAKRAFVELVDPRFAGASDDTIRREFDALSRNCGMAKIVRVSARDERCR